MRAQPHKLTIRVHEDSKDEHLAGAYGGDCQVILDDMPMCWQSLTLEMDQNDFHYLVVKIAVSELDIDAQAISKFIAAYQSGVPISSSE